MGNFKIGQQVVCVHTGDWTSTQGDKSFGPAFNEIVTISGRSVRFPTCLTFAEYSKPPFGMDLPNAYHQQWFEPIADITVLESILNQETITV